MSGEKTVELRRRIPAVKVGTKLWIYSTLPVGAVIGSAVVRQIILATPEEIWQRCNSSAAIDRQLFDEYFSGTLKAYAMVLDHAERVKPVEIDSLRTLRKGFHPPQVMLKLSESETDSLSKLANVAA